MIKLKSLFRRGQGPSGSKSSTTNQQNSTGLKTSSSVSSLDGIGLKSSTKSLKNHGSKDQLYQTFKTSKDKLDKGSKERIADIVDPVILPKSKKNNNLEIQKLIEENETLRNRLRDVVNSRLSNVEKSSNENGKLRESISLLESTVDATNAERKQIESQLVQTKEESSEKQIEISRLSTLLENARSKIEELEQDRAIDEKTDLGELLDAARKENDLLKSQKATLQEQLSKCQCEMQKLKDPTKWYKYVPTLQRFLNSTLTRATNKTPFELLFGIKMRNIEDVELARLIEESIIDEFETNREELRKEAKEAIGRIQAENRRYSLRKRKEAIKYAVNDLVAIKKTQFSPSSKLFPKYLGPYKVTRKKDRDRYDVQKVGTGEGPLRTSSSADYMKPWKSWADEDDSSGSDERQDGRL